MTGESVIVQARLVKENFYYLFSRELFCIQYNHNTFTCLRGTKPVFLSYDYVEALKLIRPVTHKVLLRIDYLVGKRFLEKAVKEDKRFYSKAEFIEAYLKAVGENKWGKA